MNKFNTFLIIILIKYLISKIYFSSTFEENKHFCFKTLDPLNLIDKNRLVKFWFILFKKTRSKHFLNKKKI